MERGRASRLASASPFVGYVGGLLSLVTLIYTMTLVPKAFVEMENA